MSRFLFKIILQSKKVWLIQTDTTVGFLSQDGYRLAQIKDRSFEKPFVLTLASFKTLKRGVRVPKKHRVFVRRSVKTTFAYSNTVAIRVVKEKKHNKFIKEHEWFYSTSANKQGFSYNQEFAFSKSDIIVEDKDRLYEGDASYIYRLYKFKKQRLR